MSSVPYLDLARARARIEPALAGRWRQILDTNAFVLGPEVQELECAFCGFLEATGVVAVANGTDALVVALRALGVAPGDEVIVPAFSFFATAECVVLAGGRPVFCDIDPATFNLDVDDLAARVTERTVGVVGVHLYGRPFDFGGLREVLSARGLWLVEDAAQAHGARWRGRRVGTLGELAAWSFYPTKNLGGFGDGGAVSGMDEERMKRVLRLANHGQTSRYHHVEVGTNSRLDSLQAAVLNLRLATLDDDNAARRRLAAHYREGFEGVGDLRLPLDHPDDEPVYHQMTIASARRDALAEHLRAAGIGSSVHYPSPLHLQPALAELLPEPPSLPHAERAAAEVLCLPMFAELTADEVGRVVAAVRDFYGEAAG
jgi:dTDP-4-amino-4,6-dideoxygalactose transaminase